MLHTIYICIEINLEKALISTESSILNIEKFRTEKYQIFYNLTK